METLIELDALRLRHPIPPAAGTPGETAALAGFAAFFSSFAPGRVDTMLADTYAQDVYFNDTLKAVRGIDALRHYLGESAQAVEDCRVTIHETTRTAHDEHHVRWTMMIRFKRFKRGVETSSIGISHLRLDADGRVVYHQDYWNAADGLYQHVPLLGTAIRAIQSRL